MGAEREGEVVGGGGGAVVGGGEGGEGGEERETENGDGDFSFKEDWVVILLLIFEFQRYLHVSVMKVYGFHNLFLWKIFEENFTLFG